MTMTDAFVEERLRSTLRAKSAQVELAPEAFDPHLGHLVVEEPRRPRRRLVLVAAVVVLVFAVAVGVTAVLTEDDAADPAGPPTDPPVSQLSIVALPDLRFQSAEYTTGAGPNEIQLRSAGGTHGLQFADPTLAQFRLDASDRRTARDTIELEAGRTYTIFCPIDGHRNAGMQAVIRVRDPDAPPTKGPMPSPRPDGSIDLARVPDFIPVAGGRGYVRSEDLLAPSTSERPHMVYGDDLTTVIGHMHPGRGFVPLGVDPESVPQLPSTTTTGNPNPRVPG